ncbi:isochorismatase family protein [Streptomyces sp. NPDC004838]
MTEEQRGLLKDFRGSGMTVEPEHRAVVDTVRPGADDLVFTKWRHSAFHRTELPASMRAQGRDQLLVCGVYAHAGVLMTTADIRPFPVAVADFSHAYRHFAPRYAAERCAMTMTTAAVLDQLPVARARDRVREEGGP